MCMDLLMLKGQHAIGPSTSHSVGESYPRAPLSTLRGLFDARISS